ncbi:MAG: D-alanyl-D-alanine carboxypeptidase [Herbinix sp.]|jgi:D-alanyl-D-alanine carboxypeptidase (penicillin-binding protein 5/6)|nr:D-alanyl-D-alanine carboxypeptidase [Herbinix sp.]
MSKRKYKKIRWSNVIILFCIITLGVIAGYKSIELFQAVQKEADGSGQWTNTPYPTQTIPLNATSEEAETGDELEGIDYLHSNNAILVRLEDQKVLFKKNSDEKLYPASLTKIMTALVAIESLQDLNQEIVLSTSMFRKLYEEDASLAGFLPKEEVAAIDLIYGVLLPSGAECCIGLADEISGSEEAFTELMNKKARELGMNNTNFTNATGLHDEDHYTTAEDLALLLEYALENPTFRDVFTASRHSTPATNLHSGGITYNSTLFDKLKGYQLSHSKILGGKTGFTSEAGLCLASLAEIDGKEYIFVSADAAGDHSTEQYNITDAVNIYESITLTLGSE